MENNIADALARALVSSMEAQLEENNRNYKNPPNEKPSQLYTVGETVDVQSWTRVTRAKITNVDWVFHNRLGNWTWGYSVDQDCGLTFQFIPEGYLRKVDVNE